jgi:hypothetical protein
MSLVLCTVTVFFWIRSYQTSDAIKLQKVLDDGQPLTLRTIMFYSGNGCVEMAVSKSVLYWPDSLPLPNKSEYWMADAPHHPSMIQINAGWRRTFAGAGVIKDWEQPPASLSLLTLPGVGRLYVAKPAGWTQSFRAVWVPHWFFVLLFAAMPARKLYLSHRSWLRRRRGLCGACGYDMRGSPEKCPECGRLKPAPQAHERRANSASISAN